MDKVELSSGDAPRDSAHRVIPRDSVGAKYGELGGNGEEKRSGTAARASDC